MNSDNLPTTVGELRELAAGTDLDAAVAARAALVRLAGSRAIEVAAEAAEALAATSIALEPARLDFGPVTPGTPRLSASVAVLGSPAALSSRLKVTGPGLRARLAGDQLQIEWAPGERPLTGMISLDGPAGAADLPVTGHLSVASAGAPGGHLGLSSAGGADLLFGHSGLRGADLPGGHLGSGSGGIADLPGGGADLPGGGADLPGGGADLPSGGRLRFGSGERADPAAAGRLGVRGGRSWRSITARGPRPARRAKGLIVAGAAAVALFGGTGIAAAVTFTGTSSSPSIVPSSPPSAPSSPPSSVAPSAPTSPPAGPASLDRPAVEGTIRVGDEPEGVAVSPDSRTVYVANQNSRILSVVDLASRKVRSVTLRNTPRFVTVAPDGRRVFVSMYENDLSGSGVAVVDAPSLKVVGNLKTGVQPYALSVAPDGRLWVPIHGGRNVEIYSAAALRLTARVFVPENPHAVAFDTGGQRAFTPDHESSTVSVIDVRTDKRLRSIPVSRAPHSLAVSPDGRTVVVACFGANAVELIDTTTLQRRGPFRVGQKPQAAAFATDSGHAYAVNEAGNSVSVIDPRTGRITATVPVGRSPRTMAVAPDGRFAYVSNGDDDTISILRVS
ncbi:beta-propeller fold lactonase family protein [Paractinoplanes hotanensis]|uniref:Beta-propeller fold lactonase family protein n=1 Tax=Paractinoplanes hotanensis TaxID=2906497 RepID=A0ABT0Y970_9ACTN|nr:beta-propeller fold lactonase family protein [Actinoplanes hotanensis]MCM4082597.1 beta-propeller fold lactonase family protein [Actinoplanes hotanensis]